MHGPPMLGWLPLDCQTDVCSGGGHVFAYPSHCHFANGGFLEHEARGCLPAHHRALLFSNPVTRGWGVVCRHRIPTFPIFVVHCGELLSSPDQTPLSPIPYCPCDECHEFFEPPNSHRPSNQRYHNRLCHCDDEVPMSAYRGGPVDRHGTKDRPCSCCNWT